MKSLILAMLAVVALVALVPSVQACNYGDGSVVGGTAFSIVQQPIVTQQVYAQPIVSAAYALPVVAVQAYSQPIVSAVVGGYGSQAIVVRRSIFGDRVVVRGGGVRVHVR